MKTDFVFLLIFGLACILKFLELPGSNIIMVISLCHIAAIYLILGFYLFCDKEIDRKTFPLSIIAGIIFSLATLGILNQIMHWDYATQYALIGLSLTTILFVVSLFLKNRTPELHNTYYKNMLIRTCNIFILQLTCLILL